MVSLKINRLAISSIDLLLYWYTSPLITVNWYMIYCVFVYIWVHLFTVCLYIYGSTYLLCLIYCVFVYIWVHLFTVSYLLCVCIYMGPLIYCVLV